MDTKKKPARVEDAGKGAQSRFRGAKAPGEATVERDGKTGWLGRASDGRIAAKPDKRSEGSATVDLGEEVGTATPKADGEAARAEDDPGRLTAPETKPVDPAGEAGEIPVGNGERAKELHGRSVTSEPSGRGGGAGRTTPQAEDGGGCAEHHPRRRTASDTNEKGSISMESNEWRQILAVVERQGRENAERDAALRTEMADRDAARAKETADLRAEMARRDEARAKENAARQAEIADRDAALRTEMARRDEARAKEVADLRVEMARGFQHVTMWVTGILIAILAGFAALVGVGIQLAERAPQVVTGF